MMLMNTTNILGNVASAILVVYFAGEFICILHHYLS